MMTAVKLVALAVIIAAGPAIASNHSDRPTNTFTVEFGDLDLTKADDQAELDRRLEHAAKRVCDPGWTRSVRVATQTRDCINAKLKELGGMRDALIAKGQSSD